MADVNAFMLAGTAEMEHSIVMNTVNNMQHQNVNLAELVESIGDYIANEDKAREEKAFEYVALVLSELGDSSLIRQDIDLMVSFFTIQISTPHAPGIKGSAIGLRALIEMKGFVNDNAPTISKQIFEMTSVFHMYPVATRLEVYKALDALMSTCRSSLIDKEGSFIQGFLGISGLEKDPRCLMVVFSMVHVLINEWDVKKEISELWELTSKYFPITFSLPANELITVTPEDLKLRLRSCIASSSKFAKLSIPFLLSKLDEYAKANTKRDVIQTLAACAKNYSLNTVSSFSLKIWDALKYEVFNGPEDDLALEALRTIWAITARLTHKEPSTKMLVGTPLFRFVTPVVKECIEHLRDPRHKHAKEIARIIGAIAGASPFAFHIVVENYLLEIIAMQRDADVIRIKQEVLEVINEILNACCLHAAVNGEDYPFEDIPYDPAETFEEPVGHGGLSAKRDILLETYMFAISHPPRKETVIRATAARGLRTQARIPFFLDSSQVRDVVNVLTYLLMDEDTENQLREDITTALCGVGEAHPRHIIAVTFPAFMAFMDHFPDPVWTEISIKKASALLELMAKISQSETLFSQFWDEMLHRLLELRHPKFRPEVRMACNHVVLAALMCAIQTKHANQDPWRSNWSPGQTATVIKVFHNFFCGITKDERVLDISRQTEFIALRGLEKPDGEERQLADYPDSLSITLLGRITAMMLRKMTVDQQDFAEGEVFTLFVRIDKSLNREEILTKQLGIMIYGTHFQRRTLPLTVYILAGLHKEVSLNFDPEAVCASVISTYLRSEKHAEDTHVSFLAIIGLLYNKWCPDAPAPSFQVPRLPVDLIKDIIQNLEFYNAEDLDGPIDAAILFTKAANLKGDKETANLLRMLVEQLGHAIRGPIVAKCFHKILSPSEILDKKNFVVTRPLYLQRPFAICLPRILELFKPTDGDEVKRSYLVALAGILRWTPAEVVLLEIDVLIPLVLQDLEMLGSDAKIASIGVIEMAIVNKPSTIEGHLRTIIKRLSDPVHHIKGDPAYWPAAVRTKALKCLGVMPGHLEEATVVPYKFEVLRGLESAVSDDKRSVREEAARCRSVWFNLAEPIEGDE